MAQEQGLQDAGGKWLDAMPSASEIERTIATLEGKLEFWRVALRQGHTQGSNDNGADAPATPTIDELRKRMSPERLRILRAIVRRPKRQATIPEVAQALNMKRHAVATNMQRMAFASTGLLERLGPGRYQLSSGATELLARIEGGELEI